ncbi:hypothetical protein ACJJTC_010943 [Scirpophaga incertulas]
MTSLTSSSPRNALLYPRFQNRYTLTLQVFNNGRSISGVSQVQYLHNLVVHEIAEIDEHFVETERLFYSMCEKCCSKRCECCEILQRQQPPNMWPSQSIPRDGPLHPQLTGRLARYSSGYPARLTAWLPQPPSAKSGLQEPPKHRIDLVLQNGLLLPISPLNHYSLCWQDSTSCSRIDTYTRRKLRLESTENDLTQRSLYTS